MACCRTPPSLHPSQVWPINTKFLWHSSELPRSCDIHMNYQGPVTFTWITKVLWHSPELPRSCDIHLNYQGPVTFTWITKVLWHSPELPRSCDIHLNYQSPVTFTWITKVLWHSSELPRSCDIHMNAIHKQGARYRSLNHVWKLHYHPHLPGSRLLTHCGLMTTYSDRDLGQHWLR